MQQKQTAKGTSSSEVPVLEAWHGTAHQGSEKQLGVWGALCVVAVPGWEQGTVPRAVLVTQVSWQDQMNNCWC